VFAAVGRSQAARENGAKKPGRVVDGRGTAIPGGARVPAAIRLDAEASLAPMSPLGVVSVAMVPSVSFAPTRCLSMDLDGSWPPCLRSRSLCRKTLVCDAGYRVPDGVTSAEADPLGDRAVLLLRLGKLLLGAESLVALW